MNTREICNACGNVMLPYGELINVKVTHKNIKGLKKDTLIRVCGECYCHTLMYPVDDDGFHIVDNDYKLYYIKMKKLFKEKRDKEKPELYVPNITLKGKEKKEVVQPTPFSFTQLPKPRSRNKVRPHSIDPFINYHS